MKVIKIIGHPVSVMCVFLLLMISGEAFGGFYVVYLLLGLPHGVPHTLFAASGLICMLVGYNFYTKQYAILKPMFYLAATTLMILALINFFSASKGYNNQTFHLAIPLASFVLFGICVLCNLVLSISLFTKRDTSSEKHLRVAS